MPRKSTAASKTQRLYNNWTTFMTLTRQFAREKGHLFVYERERKAINGERARLNSYRAAVFAAAASGDRLAEKFSFVMRDVVLTYKDSDTEGMTRYFWSLDPALLQINPQAGDKLAEYLADDPVEARTTTEDIKLRRIAWEIMIDIKQLGNGDWIEALKITEKNRRDIDGRSDTDIGKAFDFLLGINAIDQQVREELLAVPIRHASGYIEDRTYTPFVRNLKEIDSIEWGFQKTILFHQSSSPLGNPPTNPSTDDSFNDSPLSKEEIKIKNENEAIAEARRNRIAQRTESNRSAATVVKRF